MWVPFLDLKSQYASIRGDVDVAFRQVVEASAFAADRFVERFEEEFAGSCRMPGCVSVGSGMEALRLSLLGLGVGPGDEVITVPNTFVATTQAICSCRARPVFVDVREDTYTMDPERLDAAITPRTRAVIPVHLFGQTADMDPILEIARSRGLYVVEDAAQAQGAEYKGRPAGTMGDAGCFSFYPGRRLGTYGDGGAVVTSHVDLARNIRTLRDQGRTNETGKARAARMDGFHAAILSVRLKHLPRWIEGRRSNAKRYDELLAGDGPAILPKEAGYGKHVYHVYAIRVPARDALIRELEEKDIFCGIHYPVPIHLQRAYRFLRMGKGSFPVAEKCASGFVSLPVYPELSVEQIELVVREIRRNLASAEEGTS